MRNNPDLQRPGIPAPLVVIQDAFRLMAFEWFRIDSYFTRDLNFIEWILQGGRGDERASRLGSETYTYKTAIRKLFYHRRRLNRYRHLIREQLASCRSGGRPGWMPAPAASPTSDGAEVEAAESRRVRAQRVADELAGDFAHVEMLMAQSFDRLEQSLRHMASETTLREAERAGGQNRVLLVLALAGTFFLPISAVAAVFSMTGDWAPDQVHFPLFWAVCGSITAGLIVLLLVIVRWTSIRRWTRVMRRRGSGYESLV